MQDETPACGSETHLVRGKLRVTIIVDLDEARKTTFFSSTRGSHRDPIAALRDTGYIEVVSVDFLQPPPRFPGGE
jgi:hypothetical protein